MTAEDTALVVVCYVAIVAIVAAIVVRAFIVGRRNKDLLGFWMLFVFATIFTVVGAYGYANHINMLHLPVLIH